MLTDEQAVASVSESIRRILNARGLKTHWLVLKLQASPGAIYPIVRGEVHPSVGMTARIAEALGVSVDDLLPPREFKIPEKKTSRKIRQTA